MQEKNREISKDRSCGDLSDFEKLGVGVVDVGGESLPPGGAQALLYSDRS